MSEQLLQRVSVRLLNPGRDERRDRLRPDEGELQEHPGDLFKRSVLLQQIRRGNAIIEGEHSE